MAPRLDADEGDLSGLLDLRWQALPSSAVVTPRILRRFELARSRAAEIFPRVLSVAIGIDSSAGTSGRQFGYCADDDPVSICLAPRLEAQEIHRIDGVIRHEFGHAIDFLYALPTIERRLGVSLQGLRPERRADEIAGALWGRRILYDADDVQSTRHGRPFRPPHLKQ